MRVYRESYSKIRFYPTCPTHDQKEDFKMESYVERWQREQKEKKAARKKQKAQKGQKEVKDDGKDSRGEGHEAQTESGNGE